ncbi:helix-turn-helix domain-containing protein [Desmospora activa]|uniref:Cro/C1-type helix-turn-helix DNA-binding protein n=1 Tax=Desmospora activa DSM 45169 TaxID=1121389 RepID=A0A2T4YYW2_9BACL|nr:helix-turn-helix transcriptional regulator [Desmospora activa]PTM51938.1 Cro/C1-type helix-turn-helix DNA-binding protein [Desmospora activa DSM 45169]
MLTFEPLRIWFVKQNKNRTDMCKKEECGFSPQTVAKIWRDARVRSDVIERICETYNLPVEQVMQYKKQDGS